MGLDTSFSYLPDEMRAGANSLEDAAEAILTFNRGIIDAVSDIVPLRQGADRLLRAVRHGGASRLLRDAALCEGAGACRYHRRQAQRHRRDRFAVRRRLPRRNERGGEHLLRLPFRFSHRQRGIWARTASRPLWSNAKKHDKGIFVLVKTSNPSSGELQNLKLGGRPHRL